MKALIGQIRTLLKARYPILLLVTYEEDRVQRALADLCASEERALYQWTRTQGLIAFDGTEVADTYLADRALQAIESVDESAVFVFSDLDPDLTNASVIRRLRDLVRLMGPKKQTLCVMSDRVTVPRELAKDVAILDVPLPDAVDVSGLLAGLEKRHKLKIPADRREVAGSLGSLNGKSNDCIRVS